MQEQREAALSEYLHAIKAMMVDADTEERESIRGVELQCARWIDGHLHAQGWGDRPASCLLVSLIFVVPLLLLIIFLIFKLNKDKKLHE